MTGTAVAVQQNTLPTALPDFLQSQEVVAQVQAFNAAAMGGIKSGGFPRISVSGSKFFIIDSSAENPRQLITTTYPDPNAPGGMVSVPAAVLSAVVVGANPNLSKVYYEGPYVPGDDREPDCSSDDGIRPDAHILEPRNNACATCPMNAWGSKITPQGKETKACADSKRLVILSAAPGALQNYKALALNITPAMLKDWGVYVRSLSQRQIPVHGVVTRLTFDPTVDFPKLNFTFERFLSKDEFDVVVRRMQSDEVKNIEKPVRTPSTPALAAPTATALPQIPAPPAHIPQTPPPAPVAAPQPAPAPVAADPFSGAAAAVAQVQPTTTAPSPAAQPAPPPAPVDPLAGLPPEVVATINMVGGIGSPAGAQIAAAARAAAGNAPPPAVAQAAATVAADPPKRTRGRPAKTQPADPQPPAAPAAPVAAAPEAPPPAPAAASAPQPAPAQLTTGFASSPATTVVPAGTGIASQLDSLLEGIMKGQQ